MATQRSLAIEDGNTASGGSIISSRERAYKDIDLSFTPKPNGDIYKKTDAAAVKQSVKTLLMTGQNERPFNPTFGANLGTMLFENATSRSRREIELLIRAAVEGYEPRAEILDININEDIDRNDMHVRITFKVQNTQEQVTIETSLSRLR